MPVEGSHFRDSMVEYTEWIEIGNEVYKAKGGSYQGRESVQSVISVLAAYWQENKTELMSASRQEARRMAQRDMDV